MENTFGASYGCSIACRKVHQPDNTPLYKAEHGGRDRPSPVQPEQADSVNFCGTPRAEVDSMRVGIYDRF